MNHSDASRKLRPATRLILAGVRPRAEGRHEGMTITTIKPTKKVTHPMNIVFKSWTAAGCSLLLALAGCSSTPTEVNTGAIHATTFNFVGNGAMPSASYADNRQQMHELIQEAITKNLAQKGLTRAPSAADVTVAYLVIVGNNASTAAINDYFGYGRDAAELHDKAQDAYTSSKNPNYFEAGTLVIDLIDSQTYKLLKRSHVTRPILRNASETVRREHIQGAVDAALKDLRIAG